MSVCFVTADGRERGEKERIGGNADVKDHGPRKADSNPSIR